MIKITNKDVLVEQIEAMQGDFFGSEEPSVVNWFSTLDAWITGLRKVGLSKLPTELLVEVAKELLEQRGVDFEIQLTVCPACGDTVSEGEDAVAINPDTDWQTCSSCSTVF